MVLCGAPRYGSPGLSTERVGGSFCFLASYQASDEDRRSVFSDLRKSSVWITAKNWIGLRSTPLHAWNAGGRTSRSTRNSPRLKPRTSSSRMTAFSGLRSSFLPLSFVALEEKAQARQYPSPESEKIVSRASARFFSSIISSSQGTFCFALLSSSVEIHISKQVLWL